MKKRRPTRSRKRAEPEPRPKVKAHATARGKVSASRPSTLTSLGKAVSRLSIEGILLAALISYGVHQFHWLLMESHHFRIQSYEILGNDRISDQQIVLFSGIEPGMAAFRVDPAEVSRRILFRSPKLESCQVSVTNPKVVRIEVAEKPAIARIPLEGGFFEVGSEGEIMIPAEEDSELPLLLDAQIEEETTKRLSPIHLEKVKRWFPVLKEPPTHDFESVRFGGGGRLDVAWRGVRLVVDDPDRFRKHRSFLGPVLADAAHRGLTLRYIDLRFQDVVARYETPKAPGLPGGR